MTDPATLATQVAALEARLAHAHAAASAAMLDQAIDLALDCNAARREDMSIRLLAPLTQAHGSVAKLWQVLALAQHGLGEMPDALASIARAAALAPRDARIALARAQFSYEAGLPAVPLFQPLVAAFPNERELALSYAGALIAEGQAEAAEALLEAHLAAAPDWLAGADALVRLRAILGSGDPVRGYVKAVAQQPQHAMIWAALVRTLVEMGAPDRAMDMLASARRAAGDVLIFDALEAGLASEAGDASRADALFARLDGQDDPAFALPRVRHLLKSGRIEAAAVLAEAQLAGPLAPHIWPYAGLCWRLLGDQRAAWLDGAPPYVQQVDLGLAEEELARIASVLRALHRGSAPMPGQSVRGGTQTMLPLFSSVDPVIRDLRARVIRAVEAYAAGLPPHDAAHPLLGPPRTPIRFAGSWSVRLAEAGFHVAHTHPQGWISSALHIAVPAEADDPAARRGWLTLGAPPPELGLDCAPHVAFQPRPGWLVLFPSTMWHGTSPFGAGERLTVAFDVAPPAA